MEVEEVAEVAEPSESATGRCHLPLATTAEAQTLEVVQREQPHPSEHHTRMAGTG